MQFFRRYLALIASLLVAGMGALLFFGQASFLGTGVLLAGLGLVAWQGIRLYQNRTDPYDLSRLYDEPSDPYEEADEDYP